MSDEPNDQPTDQPTDEDKLLRELLVPCDGVSIPVFGMAPVGLFSKLMRKSVSPTFAVESRRIIRVESEQVPKRIFKHFKVLQKSMTRLSFHPNFFATIPAIGPLAIAMMSMITPSGKSCFLAVRTVIRKEGELVDSGHHGYYSYLDSGEAMVTLSPCQLPKPRAGIHQVILKEEDPEAMLREHRKRMREFKVEPVDAADVVEFVRHHNWLDVNDCVERELIRAANTGEISRIRGKSKR